MVNGWLFSFKVILCWWSARVSSPEKPTSFYDLFRVENGKIAEHWGVMETILPESGHSL
jgi:predicted SnoaL-like aldol condensation-catalyzing enzyme